MVFCWNSVTRKESILVVQAYTIEEVVDGVDWNHIHNAMGVMGWGWEGEAFPPSTERLRVQAKRLLNRLTPDKMGEDDGVWATGCGGIIATLNLDEESRILFTLAFDIATHTDTPTELINLGEEVVN